jgi:hypothetical protein
MKLLIENFRKFLLKEATDLLTSQNGNVIIFADWVKGHIERGHKEPGEGSIFADFDLGQVADAISAIDVNPDQGVYTISVPGVGYNLVLPMKEAVALPAAERTEVTKEERQGKITVPAVITSAPLDSFLTDELSIVVRPTDSLEYVPDDVKEQVAPAVEEGRAYSILSAWPGRGDVPPASQWGENWAVIIPQ